MDNSLTYLDRFSKQVESASLASYLLVLLKAKTVSHILFTAADFDLYVIINSTLIK